MKPKPSNKKAGRKPKYPGEKMVYIRLRITETSRDVAHDNKNPIKSAGYKSISHFMELALRGEVEIPSRPESQVFSI